MIQVSSHTGSANSNVDIRMNGVTITTTELSADNRACCIHMGKILNPEVSLLSTGTIVLKFGMSDLLLGGNTKMSLFFESKEDMRATRDALTHYKEG